MQRVGDCKIGHGLLNRRFVIEFNQHSHGARNFDVVDSFGRDGRGLVGVYTNLGLAIVENEHSLAFQNAQQTPHAGFGLVRVADG